MCTLLVCAVHVHKNHSETREYRHQLILTVDTERETYQHILLLCMKQAEIKSTSDSIYVD
jgi:hypothetical protein